MSVAHRSIARLPHPIFENLSGCCVKDTNLTPEETRAAIVKKLKLFPIKKWYRTVYKTITTVGPLLRLSLPSLLRALDPILTYSKYFGSSRRRYRYRYRALSYEQSFLISLQPNAGNFGAVSANFAHLLLDRLCRFCSQHATFLMPDPGKTRCRLPRKCATSPQA